MRKGVVVMTGALLLTISACGGGGTDAADDAATDSTLPTPTSPVPPTTAATTGASVTIPDGTYSRVVIREEAIAAGFDPELVDKFLEADGKLPMTIKVAGDRWTHFVTNDAGIPEIGDAGTASYDDDGHWVLVNPSGRVLSYEWSLTDGSLTLTIISSSAPGEADRPPDDEERLITEGVYEQGP
jgi:hypothetical protein